MVRANLYERGKDAAGDRAIDLFRALDGFISERHEGDTQAAYQRLATLLHGDRADVSETQSQAKAG